MKKLLMLLVVLLLLLSGVSAQAAQIRVFVADMSAVGVQNRDEMKATLQMLLSSRLNSDKVLAVGSAAEADALVSGTYVVIGKVFSVDALARTAAGKTLARAFVQGESQDELIPAVGKLAEKLTAELTRVYTGGPAPAAVAPALLPGSAAPVAAKSDIIKNEQQLRPAPAGEFIKPAEYERGSAGGWQSKRLDGAANLCCCAISAVKFTWRNSGRSAAAFASKPAAASALSTAGDKAVVNEYCSSSGAPIASFKAAIAILYS